MNGASSRLSRASPRGRADENALPVAIVLVALFAFWYVAAALMNAPLQRDVFANAGRDGLFDRRARRRFAQHGAPETPRAASDRRRTQQTRIRDRADLEARPRLSRLDHVAGDADRLLLRRFARHRPGGPRHLRAQPRAIDDAVDRRLADRADHRAGADDRGDPQSVRHHRARAQGGDRRLSLVFPRHRRHGQRPAFARSAATRSHAHLFGDVGADIREIARAGERCRSFSPA